METNEQTTEPAEPTTEVEVDADAGESTERSEDTTPADRPSRKERREAKKQDFNAELRQRDEMLSRERQEREAIARDLAELRGRVSERERQSQKDPYEDQLTDLEKQSKAHLRAAAAMMEKNPQEAERLVDEHRKVERAIARLEWQREQDQRQAEVQRNAPQPIPPAVQHDVIKTAQEFPWLQTHARARAAADSLVDEMVANGHPPNYNTMKAAASQVAVAFGLGGQTAPTEGQRQRYRGVGAGAAASESGDGKKTVVMGRHEVALARALANREGKGASDEEAQAQWAQRVGSRINRQG